MSDRIAVMNRGVIEQVAAPADVYDRPATTFVAGFIGVSNLMPGRVVAVNGTHAQVKLHSGPTVAAPADGLASGQDVNAVVRPEKLEVGRPDSQTDPAHAHVRGVVDSSLYLGTATQMVVRLPDEVRMSVLVPNADERERRSLPQPGDDVRLSWSVQHMHVVKNSIEPPEEETPDEPA